MSFKLVKTTIIIGSVKFYKTDPRGKLDAAFTEEPFNTHLNFPHHLELEPLHRLPDFLSFVHITDRHIFIRFVFIFAWTGAPLVKAFNDLTWTL